LTRFFVAGILLPYMAEAEIRPRSRALLWWGITLLVLLGGYADLARGGETIAPILLVLGYCVLVPLAILRS
jgi:hypothetical protein